MFMRSLSCCTLILALAPAAALAERPPQYFAIEGATYEYDPGADGVSTEDGASVRLNYGYALNRFWGFEVHFGMEGGQSNLREGALLGRFNLPYERLNVYALAGVGRVGISAGDERTSGSGPAIGVGIDLYGSEHSAVALEFLRYEVDEDDADEDGVYDAVTLGWKHHFEWPEFRPEL